MLSPNSRICFAALVVLFSVGSAGCYRQHPCSTEEQCDYRDNTCNDRVDEDFRDSEGRYVTLAHCGGCGVHCDEVFPTAESTSCIVGTGGNPECTITACPEGTYLVQGSYCAPEVEVLCLPCSGDDDCRIRDPRGICVVESGGTSVDGSGWCSIPCVAGDGGDALCGETAECDADESHCVPTGGDCSCNAANEGLEIGCLVDRGDGYQCAGAQVCTAGEFGTCGVVSEEQCNGQDDDCDFGVDEDFRDAMGRYVHDQHCGACGQACVVSGENMVATCRASGSGPMGTAVCDVQCETGFVDVDGIAGNGCECELYNGMGPPPEVGGDGDCDGVPDGANDYIFVTPSGDDVNPGTLALPVRTVQRGLALGDAGNKDVLVARGIYRGPVELRPGVDLFGGYRADFQERDLELYPVRIEQAPGMEGHAVLVARNISVATAVEGLVVTGSIPTSTGAGSTAVYLDGNDATLLLRDLTVLAAAAADGYRGEDSSARLATVGASSLADLDGANGTDGSDAASFGCPSTPGGSGGGKSCGGSHVSGGGGGAGACPNIMCTCPPGGCTQAQPCGNAGCTYYTQPGGSCDVATMMSEAVPNPAATSGQGASAGTAGSPTYNAPTTRGACNFCDDNPSLARVGGNGGDGSSGVNGSSGGGCGGATFFNGTTGQLQGLSGSNGTGGTNGSGGGGGTAGSGYSVVQGVSGCSDRAGGAGGGGGSAGCGAPGATGGGGGGTSVAMVVRTASGSGPVLENVRVVTASGGAGGDGGIGASGGSAGVGGLGGTSGFWCARNGGRGGDGGRGGNGGAGGGGCGGGSHGIAITGASASTYETQVQTWAGNGTLTLDEVGVAGTGGEGGFAPHGSGTHGISGSTQAVVVF